MPVLAVAAAGAAMISRKRGWGGIALLAASVAAAGLGFVRFSVAVATPRHHVSHVLAAEPELARICGQIVTQPLEAVSPLRNPFLPLEPPSRTTFVVALEHIVAGDAKRLATGRVLVRVDAVGLGLSLGDRTDLTGRLYGFGQPRNPGETDWAAIRRRQSLDAGMIVPSAALVCHQSSDAGWMRIVHLVRSRAHSMLFEPLAAVDATECMQLLDVLVLGQRSAADRRIDDAFQRAGGVHFLSVGGFHVGVLAGAVWGVVRLLRPRARRAAAWITLAVTLVYLVLAEQTSPALRGVLAVGFLSLAAILGRPLTSLNGLAAAAIIILLINPHELFRASFQLSFVLVLALILWTPPLWDRVTRNSAGDVTAWPQFLAQRVWRMLLGLAICTAICAVAALPLGMHHFHQIAPWGLLGAILLTPLISATIILSFVTMAASAGFAPLGEMCGAVLAGLVGVLLALVDLLGRLPGAVLLTPTPPSWLVVATYGAALAAEWYRRRTLVSGLAVDVPDDVRRAVEWRSIRRFLAVLSVAAVAWLGWGIADLGPARSGYTLRCLAVGDGSATTLVGPEGEAAVFDAGSAENFDVGAVVAGVLRHDRVGRVEWALVSHANFDHYSGIPTLERTVSTAHLASGPGFEESDARGTGAGRLRKLVDRPMETISAGERLACAGGTLEILWPPADAGPDVPPNDASLVALWSAGGVRVLLTGDIENLAIARLLTLADKGRVDLRADVLVAPHHGEVIPGLTERFLAAVNPRHIIVSSQRPRTAFEAATRRVLGPEPVVHQTAAGGCVTFRIDAGGGLHVARGAAQHD